MKLFVNRELIECDMAITLTQLLSQNNLLRQGIAVAVDNKVVARDKWDSIILSEGMNITVIHAVCGG